MPAPDPETRARLERLRATDRTGRYAGDQPSQGSDREAALTVTVDPTLRVLRVDVRRPDAVRLPDQLAAAVAEAYRDALRARVADRRDERRRRGERPVATAAPVPRPVFDRRLLDRHQVREATRAERHDPGRARRLPRPGVGRSRNGCVVVRLGLVSPVGPVETDPGWLATATADHLGNALTEAFRAAYEERGI